MLSVSVDEARRIMRSWSREVELTLDGDVKVLCMATPGCLTDYFVTAGRDDRVRCPRCKTLYMVEL